MANEPKVEADLDRNPMMNYFKNCNKEYALALPVLNKISKKVLSLQGYKLNEGIATGMKEGLATQKRLITTVVFDNNGMSDQAMSTVIEGLATQEFTKSITLILNEFGEKSLASLIPILQRKKPKNLEELRLIYCKTNSSVITSLIEEMSEEQCFLKKLSLVNMQLNDNSFRHLQNLIENNRNLKEIDISSNSLKKAGMLKLL